MVKYKCGVRRQDTTVSVRGVEGELFFCSKEIAKSVARLMASALQAERDKAPEDQSAEIERLQSKIDNAIDALN